MSSKPLPQGSLVVLWAGENPAVHAALLEELQAADIPFSDKTLGDDEVAPTADPLPIDWKPRFGFEVAVLSADLAAAKRILEKLLEEEPADLEIPAQDEVAAAEPPLVSATETRPTVEIWNGNDERIAQFLTAAMQENDIPIHLENPGEQTRIYVSAGNEKRAREIVREVVEGAPPK
jgi:NADPH-dependent ferric siderophore reductase